MRKYFLTTEKEIMRPKKSYRIWMTQRTGSTLLCKGLESTGIAGKPEEFLTLHGEKNFQERYHTQNYQAMREKINKITVSTRITFSLNRYARPRGRAGRIFFLFLSRATDNGRKY